MNRRHFLKDTLASFELIGVSRLPELKEGLASLGSQAHPSSGGEIDLRRLTGSHPRLRQDLVGTSRADSIERRQ
jgi:hypothetical protein